MHGWGKLPWKLFKVISGLPCLALEIMLSNGDMFLIGVVSLLVVAFIIAGSDLDSLGSLLWHPLITSSAPIVTIGASLGALAGRFEWHPLPTARGSFPVTMDKNGPDRLLVGSVPGGDIKQPIHGLWSVATELMHHDLVVHF
jgi:hypothetical protein